MRKIMYNILFYGLAFALCLRPVRAGLNVSYNNPIMPGWHSDPSCVFVAEFDNTFFCTTSTFMAFPGNPVYASRDLINWKLASNSVSRPSQMPEIRTATNQQYGGFFANTLRYHNGTFYLISTWANTDYGLPRFTLSSTIDPFSDESWSDVLWIETPGYTIDPDIFFDDDGSIIVSSAGVPPIACYLDINTGKTTEVWDLWNGTGGISQEGPHIYKKDSYYYLLIAEGGTQLGHAATIARSRSLKGPWEPSPHNPLVSNAGTNEYFQTVGHADLFQDEEDNWWGVALSTRGGPDLYDELIFPMGRETTLYPVSWPNNGWPVADQVRGTMKGPLPQTARSIPSGIGPYVAKADSVDFEPGSSIPNHWLYWRAPFDPNYFTVSPQGHPNTLRLTSSRANLTADAQFNATYEGLTAVFRRQEHTFFNFTVDLHLGFGGTEGDEIGVSSFLNQDHHVDLGIVYINSGSDCQHKEPRPHFRFRANSVGHTNTPNPKIIPVPFEWLDGPIRVSLSPLNESHYAFFVAAADSTKVAESLAVFTTALLSGDGAGTGTILGVYSTTNGGNHSFDGYVSRWRYTPVAQKVDYGVIIPATLI